MADAFLSPVDLICDTVPLLFEIVLSKCARLLLTLERIIEVGTGKNRSKEGKSML